MSSNSESEYIEYGSECYQVQCIRERKYIRGKPHYFIKWKGWDEKDNTWEPVENLQTVMNLVKDFDRQLDGKNQSNTIKRDKKAAVEPKPTQTASNDMPKKTKIIQKDKNNKSNKKPQKQKSQGQMSQSQSEQSSVSSRKSNRKKVDKKQPSKKVLASEPSEKMKSSEKDRQKQKEKERQLLKQKLLKEQKQKQKERERQKQKEREKNKEKTSETPSARKIDSNTNIQAKQSEALQQLHKQSSSKMSIQQPSDYIQITRINYHILVPPDQPSQVPKLFYNVDRRNRLTKKSLAVTDLPSEELLQKNVQMVVEYLENFIKQVEICAMEEREYEKRKNGQATSTLGEAKLGIMGKIRK